MPSSDASTVDAPLGAVVVDQLRRRRPSRSRDTACDSSSVRARRLAEPERNRRRLALRILDAHAARLDAQDPIRRVAELEDVAGEALDREVLVDRADELARGLEHDVVVGGVGNRAARRERGQPRAAPAAQHAVDGVAMEVRGAMAAARGEALGEHAHDVEVLVARQLAYGYARVNERRTARLRSIRARRLRRRSAARARRAACAGIVRRSSSPRAHRIEQRRAFDQLVARQRKEPRLRHAADRVARAPGALQERRDRARRAELADELDVADVDAELERRGRDQRLAARRSSAAARPSSRRSFAMLPWCDITCSSPSSSDRCRATRSAMRRVLTNTSVVRCCAASVGEPRVDLLPHLVRHHRLERRRRALRARDRARARGRCRRSRSRTRATASRRSQRRRTLPTRKRAISSIGFCVADRPMRTRRRAGAALRARSSDSARWLPRLFAGERVDLVDDDGARRREHRAARLRAEQHVQRLRRRDDDVRRPPAHARALGLRRVAGAHQRADVDVGEAEGSEFRADAGERRLEIACECRWTAPSAATRRRPRFVGQRPSTPSRTSSSMAARNAASVLPEPVGAAISTLRRRGSAARRAPARSWARETACGTRQRRPGETKQSSGYFLISRHWGNRLAASR